MKWCFFLVFFWPLCRVAAQRPAIDYDRIEREVQDIESVYPDSLALRLTASRSTNYEKVRAIFRWITYHISYNVGSKNYFRDYHGRPYAADISDTVRTDVSGIEAAARTVLKRKVAVCDGYTKLFKTLCDYAGIPSQIIYGYARGDRRVISKTFNCNHSWNAVFLDSSWHLLDVTWASGYVTYGSEFIQEYDDYYFLTPPAQFVKDHFPDDIRWALLDHAPAPEEFDVTPYKSKSFVKYQISSFYPLRGIIDAAIGDTVELKVVTVKKKNIAQDAFFDSTILTQSPNSIFIAPANGSDGPAATYKFVVDSPAVEWLNLVYNEEPIMRYRLRIRDRNELHK